MLPTTSERHTALTAQDAGWGTEGTSSKDLMVSKIQVVQANSNASKEGVGRPGEIIVYPTNEILAKKGEKVEFLPILCVGSWTVSEQLGPKELKFLRKEPLTPMNDSDRWKQEDFEDGKPIVRQKCLSYLVLLANRISGFPFFIDFQRTNKNSGKLLSTIIQENKLLGKPAPSRVVTLTTQLKTYQQNSWFTFAVTPLRDSTIEEITTCKKWYDLFAAKRLEEVQGDSSDDGVL